MKQEGRRREHLESMETEVEDEAFPRRVCEEAFSSFSTGGNKERADGAEGDNVERWFAEINTTVYGYQHNEGFIMFRYSSEVYKCSPPEHNPYVAGNVCEHAP